MFSTLLLQASNAESDLKDHLLEMAAYSRSHELSASEKALAMRLHTRLSKLGGIVLEAVNNTTRKRSSSIEDSHEPQRKVNKVAHIIPQDETVQTQPAKDSTPYNNQKNTSETMIYNLDHVLARTVDYTPIKEEPDFDVSDEMTPSTSNENMYGIERIISTAELQSSEETCRDPLKSPNPSYSTYNEKQHQKKMQSQQESVVSVLMDKLDRSLHKVAQLEAAMDLIGNNVLEINAQPKVASLLVKPVTSAEELTDLENALADETKMRAFADSLSNICGKSGLEHGIDSCYKLVDRFFDRVFLTTCSWTGSTRQSEGTKTGLKFFSNTRRCFFHVVLMASKDFTECECDEFFKRVLKNSLQRSQSRFSTSRHRQKRSYRERV